MPKLTSLKDLCVGLDLATQPLQYLEGLTKSIDDNDVLLSADEIQKLRDETAEAFHFASHIDNQTLHAFYNYKSDVVVDKRYQKRKDVNMEGTDAVCYIFNYAIEMRNNGALYSLSELKTIRQNLKDSYQNAIKEFEDDKEARSELLSEYRRALAINQHQLKKYQLMNNEQFVDSAKKSAEGYLTGLIKDAKAVEGKSLTDILENEEIKLWQRMKLGRTLILSRVQQIYTDRGEAFVEDISSKFSSFRDSIQDVRLNKTEKMKYQALENEVQAINDRVVKYRSMLNQSHQDLMAKIGSLTPVEKKAKPVSDEKSIVAKGTIVPRRRRKITPAYAAKKSDPLDDVLVEVAEKTQEVKPESAKAIEEVPVAKLQEPQRETPTPQLKLVTTELPKTTQKGYAVQKPVSLEEELEDTAHSRGTGILRAKAEEPVEPSTPPSSTLVRPIQSYTAESSPAKPSAPQSLTEQIEEQVKDAPPVPPEYKPKKSGLWKGLLLSAAIVGLGIGAAIGFSGKSSEPVVPPLPVVEYVEEQSAKPTFNLPAKNYQTDPTAQDLLKTVSDSIEKAGIPTTPEPAVQVEEDIQTDIPNDIPEAQTLDIAPSSLDRQFRSNSGKIFHFDDFKWSAYATPGDGQEINQKMVNLAYKVAKANQSGDQNIDNLAWQVGRECFGVELQEDVIDRGRGNEVDPSRFALSDCRFGKWL